jgi:nitrogen-specific signal transduction histidine kinase
LSAHRAGAGDLRLIAALTVGWVEPRLVAARPTARALAIGGPHDAEHRSTHTSIQPADGQIIITTDTQGSEVIVEAADNGCGISDEVLPQIFDPLFTTKGVGDGTGLGLSITHSMVQDHGGHMEVESVHGLGACFRVILPVARVGR